jgi:hypothetical protein
MTTRISSVDPRRATHQGEQISAEMVIRHLHGLVTHGPWDLDIASAMSVHGYDAVKWTEGQGMLAELVDSDVPTASTLTAAIDWYNEAALVAQDVLATRPGLLAKFGLAGGHNPG